MIRLEGVSVRFEQPGGDVALALNNLSLTVPTGQFLTVIGTNGSGKSTLLNAIAGGVEVDSGAVIIGEENVVEKPEWARAGAIGRVFQNPFHGTSPSLTVAENLHLAAQRGRRRFLRVGLSRKTQLAYAEALARFGMGLDGRLNALAGTLSGGQRQALTLLMATLVQPEVLLLDEHTAALDPRAAEQIMGMTRSLVSEGNLTAVMVTHSMSHALTSGHRTLLMHRGKIVEDLSGAEREASTPEILTAKFEGLYRQAAAALS